MSRVSKGLRKIVRRWVGFDQVSDRFDAVDAALQTLEHRSLVMNGQVDRLKAQSDRLIHRLPAAVGNGIASPRDTPVSPTGVTSLPTLHFLIVYDFTDPSSRSFALAAAQLRNFARYLAPKRVMAVTAICLGPVPDEVQQAAIETKTRLHRQGRVDRPIASVIFSHKLHALTVIEADGDTSDRYIIIDHDIFFLEPPTYLLQLPSDAFCAKLDPLRRISNEDWIEAETIIRDHGILARFLPPMHLTGDRARPAPMPASERIYVNGGVMVLPRGKDAAVLLKDYRGVMEVIQSRGIRTAGIGDCDQFAISIAAARQRLFRLDASVNFQANNILEGYRPGEISAVHFAGNLGASLHEVNASFLQNMLAVCAQVSDPDEAEYYRELAQSIHRTIEHTLVDAG